jgi:hypothetical protein
LGLEFGSNSMPTTRIPSQVCQDSDPLTSELGWKLSYRFASLSLRFARARPRRRRPTEVMFSLSLFLAHCPPPSLPTASSYHPPCLSQSRARIRWVQEFGTVCRPPSPARFMLPLISTNLTCSYSNLLITRLTIMPRCNRPDPVLPCSIY